jgi:hypothetical protein
MSPLVALAVSIALLGGVATVLFLTQGLLVWAGFLAWATFLQAGGDTTALKKTIVGSLFGALLGWAAIMLLYQIPIPEGSWLWMPRYGVAVAATLLVLGLAAKIDLLSSVSISLAGYAAVIGAFAVEVAGIPSMTRLTSLHLYNPFFVVGGSMIGGALFGFASKKLAAALTKS